MKPNLTNPSPHAFSSATRSATRGRAARGRSPHPAGARPGIVRASLRVIVTLAVLALSSIVVSADDGRHLSRPLGTNPVNVERNDTIAAGDWLDYYKFDLTEKRAFQATLSNLSVDANLYVMSTTGHVIKLGSARNGLGTTSVRLDLDRGTYHVAVYAWDRNRRSNYKLKVTSWIPVTGGVTRDLGALDGMGGFNTTKTASGTISPRQGWVDYWFTLPDSRNVQIITNSPAGAGLFNDKQQFQALVQNGRLTRVVGGGRWFVRLFRDTYKDIRFNLTVVANVPNSNDTAGNHPSRARNLGTLGNQAISVKEFVGRYDFDDYYRIYVQQGVTLNLNLTQTGENANLWLYDQSGRQLGVSSQLGRANEAIRHNILRAGTYIVRVGIAKRTGPWWENSNYTLTLGVFAAAPPKPLSPPTPIYTPPATTDLGGNTPLLARQLFNIVPPGSGFNDAIGGTDRQDWYAFRLRKNGINNLRGVTFQITGTSQNVNVFLYERLGDGSLRYLTGATNPSTLGERLDAGIPAYHPNGYQRSYVLLVTSASSVSTPYRLTTTVR